MKQYVGISRDHSGSMQSLANAAKKDYNDNVTAICDAALKNDVDTIVSVVRCGIGGDVDREIVNSSVQLLKPLTHYETDGQTPLFDSVGELITLLSAVPDVSDPDVSFLILAITDGEENASHVWSGKSLGRKIVELQRTDRWTFAFRVPRGYAAHLERLGIPSGNIQEWEQTERGLRESSIHTQAAVSNYFSGRVAGVRSTQRFYADLRNVSKRDIQNSMTNISSEVRIWPVHQSEEIRTFVEKKLGRTMLLGSAFYQLTKPEKAVQDYKIIVIRDKNSGSVFAGQSARDLLGLPDTGTIKLAPGDHGDYDIYIQSTSTNRRLIAGTNVLYWGAAGRK